MDERTRTRKRRLQQLIEGKPFLGNQSAFAERAGLSKGRITQLLDPNDSFGERSARKLAAELKLPDDYFDGAVESVGSSVPTLDDELALGLLALTKALQRADKNILIAVKPLLAAMVSDPAEAKSQSELILKLLVTNGDNNNNKPHDGSRGAGFSVTVPRITLGDENGRRDTDTGESGQK